MLGEVLKLIDQYDLYGSVAYPKRHQQSDISDIYRLPLKTKGVFTNVALQEPFGLTVIEVSLYRMLPLDIEIPFPDLDSQRPAKFPLDMTCSVASPFL